MASRPNQSASFVRDLKPDRVYHLQSIIRRDVTVSPDQRINAYSAGRKQRGRHCNAQVEAPRRNEVDKQRQADLKLQRLLEMDGKQGRRSRPSAAMGVTTSTTGLLPPQLQNVMSADSTHSVSYTHLTLPTKRIV